MINKLLFQLSVVITLLSFLIWYSVSGLAQQNNVPTVSEITWSADGAFVAVGIVRYEDNTERCADLAHAFRIYDAVSGTTVAQLRHYVCAVTALDFDPTGLRLLVTGTEGATEIWNVDSQTVFSTTLKFGTSVTSEWSTSGEQLFVAYDTSVVIFSADGEWRDITSFLQVSSVRRDPITDASWSDDDRYIAVGSGDSSVSIWDVANESVPLVFEGHEDSVAGVEWLDGTTTLASFDNMGMVLVWDALSGQIATTTAAQTAIVTDISWNADGETLAVSYADGAVRLWNTTTGVTNETVTYDGFVGAIAYSSYGGQLAVGLETDEVAQTTEMLDITVPDPSLERFQAIAAACGAEQLVGESVTDAALPDVITDLQTMTDDQIPPACAADLLAIAEALQNDR
jgi:WD40 repeat protein